MTLIYLIGIATASLLIVLWVEFVPSLPSGKAARYLRESDQPAEPELPGWRKWLAWLDRPTARWAPGSILRRTKADLYFAQLVGKWHGWDEVQFTSLRVALAVGALVFGLLIYDDLVPSVIASLLGWQVPVVLLGGVARRVRRRFATVVDVASIDDHLFDSLATSIASPAPPGSGTNEPRRDLALSAPGFNPGNGCTERTSLGEAWHCQPRVSTRGTFHSPVVHGRVHSRPGAYARVPTAGCIHGRAFSPGSAHTREQTYPTAFATGYVLFPNSYLLTPNSRTSYPVVRCIAQKLYVPVLIGLIEIPSTSFRWKTTHGGST